MSLSMGNNNQQGDCDELSADEEEKYDKTELKTKIDCFEFIIKEQGK